MYIWRIVVPNNLVTNQGKTGAKMEILIKIACPRILLEI
jgi:hypothetical protein